MGTKAKPRSEARLPQDPTYLVSHKQAAAYLGIAPMTLWHWNADGIGPPCHRISPKKVLYDLRELDIWVREGGTAPKRRRRRRQNHNSVPQSPAT